MGVQQKNSLDYHELVDCLTDYKWIATVIERRLCFALSAVLAEAYPMEGTIQAEGGCIKESAPTSVTMNMFLASMCPRVLPNTKPIKITFQVVSEFQSMIVAR